MIQANELRIGNLTNFGSVYLIEEGHFYVKDKEGCSYKNTWADIQPIAITPKILAKCGFEYVKGYMVNKAIDQCHVVLINKMTKFHVSVTGPFGMVNATEINSLHQLQNLYFALTQTELTPTL